MMSDDTSVSSICSYERNEEEMVEYNHGRVYAFNNIKRNFYGFKSLELLPYGPALPIEEWVELGYNIGNNTHLQRLHICIDGLDEEEDEIASTENLEIFLSCLANNRSLKEFFLEEYDFSRVRLGLLHPFVIENDNLVELQLHSCGFDLRDLQMLANAFRHRRNPNSMKYIALSGRNINDEYIIIEICGLCPRLQHLYLSHSGFGRQGCIHLAALLENPRCTLKSLQLDGIDAIDDDVVQLLSNSLVNNNKLKTLGLKWCDAITARGWKHFLRILHSTSDIDATLRSNHTLVSLLNPMFDSAGDDDHLPEDLLFCLESNKEKDKKSVIRRKIIRFHLDSVNLSSVIGTDQEIVPVFLGWLGKDNNANGEDEIGRSRITLFYRTIRLYPDICSFLTIDKEIRYQLEEENAKIKAENASIKSEVVTLKAENEELLRKIEQLTMGKTVS